MWHALEFEATLTGLLLIAILALKVFTLINCLLYSAESYVAASKGTKAAWGIGLGVGVACEIVGLPLFINLAFTIAALVYLADVRPALKSLTRRR